MRRISALSGFAVLALRFFFEGCLSRAKEGSADADLINNRVTGDRVRLALRHDRAFDFSNVQVHADGDTIFYRRGEFSCGKGRCSEGCAPNGESFAC
jgi:hypothetical protein